MSIWSYLKSDPKNKTIGSDRIIKLRLQIIAQNFFAEDWFTSLLYAGKIFARCKFFAHYNGAVRSSIRGIGGASKISEISD